MSSVSATPPAAPVTTGTRRHYQLECLARGDRFGDTGDGRVGDFPLVGDEPTAFLRTVYDERRFLVGPASEGLFRFASWLPVASTLSGSSAPITYHSTRLGRRLGLDQLYLTVSGWWPERGVHIPTGTFKECEAYAVYGRLGERVRDHTLVVASAGNTARAFLRVATEHDLPLVVVVPEDNVPAMWTFGRPGSRQVIVAAGNHADYAEAIAVAGMVCGNDGFLPEGGARNVARRDGMGTTFLSAAHEIGRIPDHYVQAVGSGTGAIAAWEANLRLVAAGGMGTHLARLHLAQNAPFTPLADAWDARSRSVPAFDDATAHRLVAEIDAKVLANRTPPWGPVGGLFDAMSAAGGSIYRVANREAHAARALLRETEAIDVSPAAAVAAAALVEAVREGAIGRTETVMLNVTGAGYERARADLDTYRVIPDIVLPRSAWTPDEIGDRVRTALQR